MSNNVDEATATGPANVNRPGRCPVGPVRQIALPDGQPVWLVTRHADVRATLTDPKVGKNITYANPGLWRFLGYTGEQSMLHNNMLTNDPPEHTRLRRLVTKAFTPRRVAQMRERISELTESLLDAVAPLGETDLKRTFATPLSVTVIHDMLAIPPADRDEFQHYMDAFVGLSDSMSAEDMAAAVNWSEKYLTGLIANRRENPGEDLISALIDAQERDDRLTDVEIRSTVLLLVLAGSETTVNLVANGMLCLLSNPDQLAALRADPALLPGAIEELLRFTSPVIAVVHRFPTENLTIGTTEIPAGEHLVVHLDAANHDPDEFDDPDRLDLRRDAGTQVAFGWGSHFCLGANLARIQAEVALGSLLRRFDDLELAAPASELTWTSSVVANSLEALPVTFTPRD
jgi:cytochrome P450